MMGRPIWKGYISFGLVNIPVTLYSAESNDDISFKLLDSKNLAKVKYKRVNEETGKEVAWDAIVKGYEYEKGQFAVVTKEDLEAIAQENSKTIEIEDFIQAKELSNIYFEKPYYLVPDKKGEKGYLLLRETLTQTHRVGIARVMIHSRQYLAAIIPYQDAILVNTLRYANELKQPDEFKLPDTSDYKLTKKELEIAKQLVETMSTKFKPEQYHNEYQKALHKLIEQKIASGNRTKPKKVKSVSVKRSNVVDFMELLKKSVQAKKRKATTSTKKTKGKKSARK